MSKNDDGADAEPLTAAASGGDDTASAPSEHATELIATGAAPTPELARSAAAEEQETRGAVARVRRLAVR